MALTINDNEGTLTNKYALLLSKTDEVRTTYEKVFTRVEGSLTTVSDNDAASRIVVAINNLQPSEPQVGCLNEFIAAFKYVEKCIDPSRLNFTVTKSVENEICINHFSTDGLSKIIIDEDGSIAHSFISYKGINKPDSLEFYEGDIDFEVLTYDLFS